MGDSPTEAMRSNLTRDYWAAKFPSQISCLSDGSLTANEIFTCTQVPKHQPPIQYRITFIKFVIKKLESRQESSDETEAWYESLERLSGAPVQQEPFYRFYSIPGSPEPIKIYEDEKAFVSDGSTGFITWRASLELAQWISIDQLTTTTISSSGSKNGNNCCWAFELGSGTGFLALALITKFPHLSTCFATDVHNGVLLRCGQNISGNQLDHQICTDTLDWTKDQNKFLNMCQGAVDKFRAPGILLGADVIFDVSVIPSLVRLVEIFFQVEPPGRVFFSSAIRNEATFEEFQRHTKERGLYIETMHHWGGESNGVIFEVKNSPG